MTEVAVVTGAGRGFGREIARRLAARGHAVLATDLDLADAEATARDLGPGAWAMALDVRDPDAHRAAAAAAAARGRLAVWINNAGVLRTEKVWEHSDDDVRTMVEANLLGVVWGSRAAVEAMRPPGAGGGRIVNVASMSAFGPVPGLAVYAATKAAVLNFTVSLQGDLDHARLPIRVHAICPDTADTAMVHEHEHDRDAAILFSAPRLLTPGEVADHVLELLDGERIVLAVPRSRAWLMRGFAPFPRAGLRALRGFERVGERHRSKR